MRSLGAARAARTLPDRSDESSDGGRSDGASSFPRILAVSVAAALLLVACERPPERTAPSRTPTPLDTASLGSIAGTVLFSGSVPPVTAISLDSDPTCAALHPDGLALRDVEVSDGSLAGVVVYLKSGLGERAFAVPEEVVVIDQRGCLFVPRVAAAQVGQPIRFVNSDATLHNVHGMPARSMAWNFAMGNAGASRTLTIDNPEISIAIRCEVHPWMRADIAVVDNPYYAVTGTTGTFLLERVPPGDYVIAAWHPHLGTREQHVMLAPGAHVAADFTFASPD